MALPSGFPKCPYTTLEPAKRWFPSADLLPENERAKLLPPLVAQLRIKVKEFRDSGYVGASDTSRSLLYWWFQHEHIQPQYDGANRVFQYYFAQREAMETIIYLVDVVNARDKRDLMRFAAGTRVSDDMFDENWRRYVIKMATGAGKTKVMSLGIAWGYFHKLYEAGSPMARNFLVIAPNIIVLDRLARDFSDLRIFYEDAVLPDNGFDGQNWRDDFQLTLHRQDEVRSASPVGNIFLTNIHRVYDSNSQPPSAHDDNTKDYYLGAKPTGATTDSKIELDRIVRDIDELMVINDEAHHIHDKQLAWFKSIQDIHNRLVHKGSELSLQLDLTATPRHNNGAIFVQTVADYPLVEAIAQDIVKHPVVPDEASRAKLNEATTQKFTERYADFLDLGVIEWRKTYQEHVKVGKKSILFVMVDDTRNCDEVAEYLSSQYPDFEGEDAVLTIHTKKNGEISEAATGKGKDELEKLRQLANEIDAADSPYLAIVSVMMLKEGWDVRNVTTIVGLRAYSAKSNILPEQTLGRGLRRMYPDQVGRVEEYVSVIGTLAFMEFVEAIQAEGVMLERRAMGAETGPKTPLVIEVDYKNSSKDIDRLDIELPVLTPRIYREYKNLELLNIAGLLDNPLPLKQFTNQQRDIIFNRVVVREKSPRYHHKTPMGAARAIDDWWMLGEFTSKIMRDLKLVSGYDVLYAKVKDFVANQLFGKAVDVGDANVACNIRVLEAVIIALFTKAINELTVRDKGVAGIKDTIKLQQTWPFIVNDQEYAMPKKSVFNRTVGDSHFELVFSGFLERCEDVAAHAKNYRAVKFKLDYANADGNISDYYPDFFVKTKDGKVTIVETKGQEDLNVPPKMARLKQWCEDVAQTDWPAKPWFVFVDQKNFEKYRDRLHSFSQIITTFTKYQ